VGVLGRDELSRFVEESFHREGVDTTHSPRRDDASVAHSTIVVDESRDTRTVFASVEGAIGADAQKPDAELIRTAGALLVDHHGLPGTIRAAQIARDAGVAVVGDFERYPGDEFDELLRLTDHLIISRRFARQLTGTSDPARAAEQLVDDDARTVVVTCGAEGCYYASCGNVRHVPAIDVSVVDTTGCGDVFHGAYAAALARGMELENRIKLATAVAAMKAGRRGGQAGCPSWETVQEFIQGR
jgi:ribokinase